MGLQDAADNGQSDAGSLPPGALMLASLITFPDQSTVRFGNRVAGIGDGHFVRILSFRNGYSDHAPVLGMIYGIIQQVLDDLAELQGIDSYHAFSVRML